MRVNKKKTRRRHKDESSDEDANASKDKDADSYEDEDTDEDGDGDGSDVDGDGGGGHTTKADSRSASPKITGANLYLPQDNKSKKAHNKVHAREIWSTQNIRVYVQLNIYIYIYPDIGCMIILVCAIRTLNSPWATHDGHQRRQGLLTRQVLGAWICLARGGLPATACSTWVLLQRLQWLQSPDAGHKRL